MVRLGKVVESTKNHFERNAVKGQHEFFGDGIAQIDQQGEEQPGSPDLQEDAIQGACPQVSQIEQAFNEQESFFNGSAAAIQVSDDIGWQDSWVEHAGQIELRGDRAADLEQLLRLADRDARQGRGHVQDRALVELAVGDATGQPQ